MRTTVAFAATALLTAGCYTNATVAPSDVRKIGRPAATPVALGDSALDPVRLGPRTSVRARREDGTVSPWFTAGALSSSARGLLTGRSLSLGQMGVAVVRGLGPDGPALVSFLSPPGGRMWTDDDQVTLQADGPGQLAHWAAAIASGSLAAGGAAGVWTFYQPGRGWIAENLAGADLASVSPPSLGRLRIVEGIPWSDVAALEVHNFDPLTTVAAAAGAALIVAMVIASAKSKVDPSPFIDLGARAAFAGAEEAEHNEGPAALEGKDEDERHDGFLVDAGAPAGTLTAMPLFTSRARRRDIAQLLLSVDSAWDGAAGATGAAGVGVRLFDFWELSARVRGVHLGAAADVDLASPPPAPLHLLAGGRLGVNIDGDAQPLTALTLSVEFLAGQFDDSHPMTTTTLSIGPRFGLPHGAFLSLLFSPTYISVESPASPRAGGDAGPPYPSEWRLMFGAELGLAL